MGGFDRSERHDDTARCMVIIGNHVVFFIALDFSYEILSAIFCNFLQFKKREGTMKKKRGRGSRHNAVMIWVPCVLNVLKKTLINYQQYATSHTQSDGSIPSLHVLYSSWYIMVRHVGSSYYICPSGKDTTFRRIYVRHDMMRYESVLCDTRAYS